MPVAVQSDLPSCARWIMRLVLAPVDRDQGPTKGEAVLYQVATIDVRLAVAAEMIGMSPSASSRFFKVSSGHTFSDMARRLRLAQACKLLDTTTSPVTVIASASGHRNPSNFNRQFRAELGLTPLQYRKRREAAPAKHAVRLGPGADRC